MQLTAVLLPAPEGGFTALNPETGTTTEGETVEEALAHLREATALCLEEFPQLIEPREIAPLAREHSSAIRRDRRPT